MAACLDRKCSTGNRECDLNNEAERVVTGHGKILVLLSRYCPFLITLLKKIYLHQVSNVKE